MHEINFKLAEINKNPENQFSDISRELAAGKLYLCNEIQDQQKHT
jgi:hypothetical protein